MRASAATGFCTTWRHERIGAPGSRRAGAVRRALPDRPARHQRHRISRIPRPPSEIIAGHRQIIDRAHAMGLKVYGGTLTPFQAFLPGIYYTSDRRGKAPGRQPMDQDQQGLRRGDRFRQGDTRPGQSGRDASRPTTAATICIRTMPATRRWPMPSTCRCSGTRIAAPRRPRRKAPPTQTGKPRSRQPASARLDAVALAVGCDQYGNLALSFRIGASTRCHIAVASRIVSPSRAAKGGSSRITEECAESQSSSGHMKRWIRYRP